MDGTYGQAFGRERAMPGPRLVVTRVTLSDVTTREEGCVDWILLTYRLPSEPSRHRVAVWRELRKVGAVPLQQATWALPARGDFVQAASRAVGLVEQAGGDALVFDAVPRGEGMEARLEELFIAEREDEWTE